MDLRDSSSIVLDEVNHVAIGVARWKKLLVLDHDLRVLTLAGKVVGVVHWHALQWELLLMLVRHTLILLALILEA